MTLGRPGGKSPTPLAPQVPNWGYANGPTGPLAYRPAPSRTVTATATAKAEGEGTGIVTYTAAPDSDAADRLKLLNVIGTQALTEHSAPGSR